MSRSRFVCLTVPLAAALCGLAILHLAVPAYLFRQGFPLDDAWIHAVYAREFARSATLAYNPGVPATGETSPLWAVVLAIPHALTHGERVVAATKIVGFALHAWSAILIALTLAAAASDPNGDHRLLAAGAGALVALHPDLIAASVSGMEVPLATAVMAGAAYATAVESAPLTAACAAAAFLARPESVVVAGLCPALFFLRGGLGRWLRFTGAASAGAAAAVAGVAVRNVIVSGRPLPATFYAKASTSWTQGIDWQLVGFTRLLEGMPAVGASALLAMIALAGAWILLRDGVDRPARLGATLALCGLAFCVVSFALVHPIDTGAFYHRRYVLPALLPIVAALPALVSEVAHAARLPRRLSAAAAVVAIAIWMVVPAPARYRRLANDTRNIDDVQVAFGKALARRSAAETVWVIDAGAIRYFGAPFVVDLIGLNTFELLRTDAQSYLDRHPPRYLDEFDGWSSVAMHDDDVVFRQAFTATTPYTVTSYEGMKQHTLVWCDPAGRRGGIEVRGRTFTFVCAKSPAF